MAVPDDGVLYDRWLERRDGDAFAEICRRHSPVVFDLTCRVLPDRAGAEDVLQEALLALALERTRRPVEVGVVAWLARFAICRAKNRRASEKARTRRQAVVGRERPEDVMPEDRVERREETERALAACDAEDRALLAMRFLHDWGYERIASALSITEGAARVRVHRALANVREKLGVAQPVGAGRGSDAAVRTAMALVPVLPIAPDFLEGSIRTVVDVARVRLGAEPNGLEHATAGTRSLRVALTCGAASFLLAVSAGVAALEEVSAATPEVARAAEWTDVARAVGTGTAGGPAARGTHPRRSAAGMLPRPEDWDRDPFAGAASSCQVSGRTGSVAPAAEPARDAAAPRAGAPRAGDAEALPANVMSEEPESALRPLLRGTCAAKGGSASSDDDRAGALAGSSTPMSAEAGVADADLSAPSVPAAPGTPPGGFAPSVRSRSGSGSSHRAADPAPFVARDELPEEQQALVSEAERLLRSLLDAQGGELAAPGAEPADFRRQVREVREAFGKLRRDLDGSTDAEGRRARRKAALVNRVLTTLTRSVYSADGTAPEFLWPAGAGGSRALAEVVRVLGAASPAGLLPSGALPSGTLPAETE